MRVAILLFAFFVNFSVAGDVFIFGAKIDKFEEQLKTIFPNFNHSHFMSVFDSCKKDRTIILNEMQYPTLDIEDEYFLTLYIDYAISTADALCLISRGGVGETIYPVEQDFLKSYFENTIGDSETIVQLTKRYKESTRKKGGAK